MLKPGLALALALALSLSLSLSLTLTLTLTRLVAAALKHPDASSGLRFDFCSKPGPGTPDSALVGVLLRARYTW